MRYIDADKLHYVRIRFYHDDGTIGGYNAVVPSAEINNAPTADVAEIRHGEWTKYQSDGKFWDSCVCSNCHKSPTAVGVEFFKYCPYCGARMDGGKKI